MAQDSNSGQHASNRRLRILLMTVFIPTWLVIMLFLAYSGTTTLMQLEMRLAWPYSIVQVLSHHRFLEVLSFGGTVLLFFFTVTTLPLLMILDYRSVQVERLMNQLREDLWLCGLDEKQLKRKEKEYAERNGREAFFLPMLVNLLFMWLMWSAFLFPTGMEKVLEELLVSGISLHAGLKVVTPQLAPVMWAFLGAYYYTLMVLVRRWMQADVTTNVLWKLNVRMAIAIVIGLLLQAKWPALPQLSYMVAFLAGIVPDTVLHWLVQQMKSLSSLLGKGERDLLKPSNLQQHIDGLNFWQADRLFEEGIESVQDLAMKEIPSLLMRTHFDTPLLIHWVDQALLCNQVGNEVTQFKAASIKTASHLLKMVDAKNEKMMDDVWESIYDEPGPALSKAVLHNIIEGLKNGPNLCYVRRYWCNTSTIEKREKRLACLPPYEPLK